VERSNIQGAVSTFQVKSVLARQSMVMNARPLLRRLISQLRTRALRRTTTALGPMRNRASDVHLLRNGESGQLGKRSYHRTARRHCSYAATIWRRRAFFSASERISIAVSASIPSARADANGVRRAASAVTVASIGGQFAYFGRSDAGADRGDAFSTSTAGTVSACHIGVGCAAQPASRAASAATITGLAQILARMVPGLRGAPVQQLDGSERIRWPAARIPERDQQKQHDRAAPDPFATADQNSFCNSAIAVARSPPRSR
jgi:hypothetical protein